MKDPSLRRRVLGALRNEKIDKIPVTSIGGCGGTVNVDMQKAVGVHWPEAHKDAEKMAKLAIASHELSGIENVRVPFDFVIEPEALGCKIMWGETSEALPSTLGHPYRTADDLRMPDNLLERGRIPVVLEAISILKREIGDIVPISSTVLAPFTLAGEMAGLTDFIRWSVKEPERLRKFVEFATEITIQYAKAQYQAGSDVVNVADPTAGLMGPMFRNLAKPYLQRVTHDLRGLKVLHICGRTEKILSDMADAGFDGLSIEVDDVAKAKSIVGGVRILGTVSSQRTLFSGKPEEVKQESVRALESGVDLLEPNCGVPPTAPLANVKAIVEARNEYYGSKTSTK